MNVCFHWSRACTQAWQERSLACCLRSTTQSFSTCWSPQSLSAQRSVLKFVNIDKSSPGLNTYAESTFYPKKKKTFLKLGKARVYEPEHMASACIYCKQVRHLGNILAYFGQVMWSRWKTLNWIRPCLAQQEVCTWVFHPIWPQKSCFHASLMGPLRWCQTWCCGFADKQFSL